MSDKNFTLIHYYVPEDLDDIDIPNAFGIKKAIKELTVNDIRASFPLDGEYHFRFKYKHGSEYVWMDIPRLDAKPPIIDGKIVIKASRRTLETKTKLPEAKPNYIPSTAPVKNSHGFNNHPDIFDGPFEGFKPTVTSDIKAPVRNVI